MLPSMPNRARSLGPPARSLARSLAVQRYQQAAPRPGLRAQPQLRTATTPFNDYTGKSIGSSVGMFRRVPGMGRQFRG